MSVTEPQAQSTEDQGQPAAAPAPPPTPPAPPVAAAGTAPWAADLNAVFSDETQRAQVDQFLRTKVQPYTTQLEQQAAAASDAQKLWKALETDPIDTYVAITTELYGEAAGQAVLATLQQQVNQQEQQPQQGQQQQAYDPRLEAALSFVEEQQNSKAYEAELARIVSEHPDVDQEFFHQFVAGSGGDFDEAYNAYTQFLGSWNAKHGTPPPEVPPEVPPVVMGGEGSSTSATPVVPPKQTLDQAINDFMAENRPANQAPPVSG